MSELVSRLLLFYSVVWDPVYYKKCCDDLRLMKHIRVV